MSVKREIKVVDISRLTPAEIEIFFNENYSKQGWRLIQVVAFANKNYIIAERERK